MQLIFCLNSLKNHLYALGGLLEIFWQMEASRKNLRLPSIYVSVFLVILKDHKWN